MSWLYNIFASCNGSLDSLSHKFEEFVDEILDDSVEKSNEESNTCKNEDIVVLVKFNKDDVEFLISEDRVNFSFIPSKTIEEIKLTWFDEGNPKQMLFDSLSRLSSDRKVFHDPDYFVNRIKKVYFRYINKQIVPYRYSVNKN